MYVTFCDLNEKEVYIIIHLYYVNYHDFTRAIILNVVIYDLLGTANIPGY